MLQALKEKACTVQVLSLMILSVLITFESYEVFTLEFDVTVRNPFKEILCVCGVKLSFLACLWLNSSCKAPTVFGACFIVFISSADPGAAVWIPLGLSGYQRERRGVVLSD